MIDAISYDHEGTQREGNKALSLFCARAYPEEFDKGANVSTVRRSAKEWGALQMLYNNTAESNCRLSLDQHRQSLAKLIERYKGIAVYQVNEHGKRALSPNSLQIAACSRQTDLKRSSLRQWRATTVLAAAETAQRDKNLRDDATRARQRRGFEAKQRKAEDLKTQAKARRAAARLVAREVGR